jgi:hypothetical protein
MTAVLTPTAFPLVTGPALTSCRPLLSLLDESDQTLKVYALQKLVHPAPLRPHLLASFQQAGGWVFG